MKDKVLGRTQYPTAAEITTTWERKLRVLGPYAAFHYADERAKSSPSDSTGAIWETLRRLAVMGLAAMAFQGCGAGAQLRPGVTTGGRVQVTARGVRGEAVEAAAAAWGSMFELGAHGVVVEASMAEGPPDELARALVLADTSSPRQRVDLWAAWSRLDADGQHRVLVHELGHLLGLEHGAWGCAMAPAVWQMGAPCQDELEVVRAAWFIGDRTP